MNQIVLTILALFLSGAPVAYAQTVPLPIHAGIEVQNGETLSQKSARVEGELRGLLTRFGAAYTRTQLTLARISGRNVDVSVAQRSLLLAGQSLQKAKTHIDTLAAEATVNTPSIEVLRASAIASEESLRAAQTSLIESVTALRTSLGASLSQ